MNKRELLRIKLEILNEIANHPEKTEQIISEYKSKYPQVEEQLFIKQGEEKSTNNFGKKR